jgi:uncharacterized protein
MIDLVQQVQQHRSELQELCRRHHVERLDLFGSATTADFAPQTSDLDFLVEFQPLSAPDRADAYFGLLQGLEDLFRRRIDLVTVQAIRDPRFRSSIEPQRTVLYAA